QGGVVAPRSGRDPAAERGALERLREVTQRDAVRAQLVLERGAVPAPLEAPRSGGTVDVQHLIEVAQVDSDRAAVRVADVALPPAHHRRAAAVGNRRRTGPAAPARDL